MDINAKQKLYFKINDLIKNGKKKTLDKTLIKEKYDMEIYQKLILEVAHWLHRHKTIRRTIRSIMKKQKKTPNFGKKMKYKKTLHSILNQIISRITVLTEPELIRYNNKFLEYLKDNNIRKRCKKSKGEAQELFCKNQKLILPYDRKNIFTGLLLENLINNIQIQNQILYNTPNTIINKFKYIGDESHIFKKKKFDFVLPKKKDPAKSEDRNK